MYVQYALSDLPNTLHNLRVIFQFCINLYLTDWHVVPRGDPEVCARSHRINSRRGPFDGVVRWPF